ncbi:DsbA family oxidoreductase [Allokutzneria albata]|uniref:Predicted dithiol-disulfide isomerase, DsbA family n=1 Tax=Allokutzneria albata TaxID=211114 RepID=A0A1H0C723_ALLAB|nr:DsbA family oxidoreductase [Allokutzneria albata]SDN53665.1 Predicted dithiol-disulfide isomerase, DsbA family [Allokutzneria albata]
MRLEVWSDVVCPWCYIGKRRLEQALEVWRAEGGEDVEVRWRPFQLDPGSSSDGRPLDEAMAEKFGGAEQAARMMAGVTATAAEVGLEYRLDRAVRANTFDAHRVLALAAGQGVQDAVQERLFRGYFVEGANLGDRATLTALAAEAGLPGVDLSGTGDVDALRAELAEGIAIGVRSVPTFVVGRRGVAGAQSAEVLLDLLRGARN